MHVRPVAPPLPGVPPLQLFGGATLTAATVEGAAAAEASVAGTALAGATEAAAGAVVAETAAGAIVAETAAGVAGAATTAEVLAGAAGTLAAEAAATALVPGLAEALAVAALGVAGAAAVAYAADLLTAGSSGPTASGPATVRPLDAPGQPGGHPLGDPRPVLPRTAPPERTAPLDAPGARETPVSLPGDAAPRVLHTAARPQSVMVGNTEFSYPATLRPDTRIHGPGVEKVVVEYDRFDRQIVTIYGEILRHLPRRYGLENTLPAAAQVAALAGLACDRAHLWPRQFGSEVAAGVMYAGRSFNRGRQQTLESQIRGLQRTLRPGEHLVLRAQVTSHPLREFGVQAVAARYQYDLIIAAGGRARDQHRIIFATHPRHPSESSTSVALPRPDL
ncbi:polymorphic toxin type 4 domain-containing protein [Plantactinospora sp. CA-290183]|uniref:polymorphic toxin type 4 domain-containing protein n=1 Tax=Plantactinospora sp. CA-290183 TaxID=3240006 RepID=UPI003D94E356